MHPTTVCYALSWGHSDYFPGAYTRARELHLWGTTPRCCSHIIFKSHEQVFHPKIPLGNELKMTAQIDGENKKIKYTKQC